MSVHDCAFSPCPICQPQRVGPWHHLYMDDGQTLTDAEANLIFWGTEREPVTTDSPEPWRPTQQQVADGHAEAQREGINVEPAGVYRILFAAMNPVRPASARAQEPPPSQEQ